jgi:hypothetical protein
MTFVRLQSLLALLMVSTASAQDSGAPDPPSSPSPCQKCCSPGGECSAAYHSEEGKCCGTVASNAYCCPKSANCWPCRSSYRCYTGTRSSNICALEGGDSHDNASGITFTVLLLLLLLCMCSASAWRRHRSHPFVTQNAVAIEMTPAGALYPSAVHRNGMPAQGVPVAQAMPACGQQHHVIVQGSYAGHPGYYDRGYHSGGSVAMGAGMGFLGGMMVGVGQRAKVVSMRTPPPESDQRVSGRVTSRA